MSGFSVSSFFLIFFSFTVGESEQSEMLVCTTEQAEQASQHSSLAAFASFAVQAMERQNRPLVVTVINSFAEIRAANAYSLA